ncbi:MAG TPA: hypothetical protein VHU19_04945 [Pyrinomonadaceae bacterium]|jgi:hypothetical protein|nr:hypothetical protein [Pyrinomonadaceae bacterium]
MKHLLVPSHVFFVLTFGLLLGHARAQSNSPAKTSEPSGAQAAHAPQPNAADVSSVEGILAAVYDVISGPAGKKRDWDRMRSLFAPGARLIPTSPVRPPGTAPDAPLNGNEEYAPHVLDVEGYIARASKFLEEQGFFEREVARRVETYGHVTHVWSTYESRHKAEDPKPFARGINSFQLMYDGKRWWVVTIFWEAETPRTPLPEKYLKGSR